MQYIPNWSQVFKLNFHRILIPIKSLTLKINKYLQKSLKPFKYEISSTHMNEKK